MDEFKGGFDIALLKSRLIYINYKLTMCERNQSKGSLEYDEMVITRDKTINEIKSIEKEYYDKLEHKIY